MRFSHYGSDLYFPTVKWCWVDFHRLIVNFYTFLEEMPIWFCMHFLTDILSILLFSCKCSLYILAVNSFLNI
jgi:hypothetical protein